MGARLLVLSIVFAAGCMKDLPAPAPPAGAPEPAVVAHWTLDSGAFAEHLWIEIDGTFTEGGGPQLGAGSLSGVLSAGAWTYSAPTLTLDDSNTGAHVFSAVFGQDGSLTLLQDSAHRYRFERDTPDGGADGY